MQSRIDTAVRRSGKDPVNTKVLAQCAVLVALASVFSYVEALIPVSLGVPGIKIGFANIVVVFALYRMGFKKAFLIDMLRVVLVSAMFGSVTMALYSAAGATASLLVMAVLKRTGWFSIIGVSMAGGVVHNTAQLLVAIAAVNTVSLAAYLPVLILAGMAAGIFIGIAAHMVIERLGSTERRSSARRKEAESGAEN